MSDQWPIPYMRKQDFKAFLQSLGAVTYGYDFDKSVIISCQTFKARRSAVKKALRSYLDSLPAPSNEVMPPPDFACGVCGGKAATPDGWWFQWFARLDGDGFKGLHWHVIHHMECQREYALPPGVVQMDGPVEWFEGFGGNRNFADTLAEYGFGAEDALKADRILRRQGVAS